MRRHNWWCTDCIWYQRQHAPASFYNTCMFQVTLCWISFNLNWNKDSPDPLQIMNLTTRATFETPKYLRRPRDQYTAQIVIHTLELSAPPPVEVKQFFNLVISLVKFQTTNSYAAAKNSRIVKQSSDLKTSSIPLRRHWKPNCQWTYGGQICHLWPFCWYRSLAMCGFTNIHGSVAFPALLPID